MKPTTTYFGMRFMCVTPRSASINKRFKLSWYICPIRRRDRYNYISNFCCCSISYRTTIHYQYFHFDLRFHVPLFYMISQNHHITSNNHRLDKRKSPINGLFTPFMKLCFIFRQPSLSSKGKILYPHLFSLSRHFRTSFKVLACSLFLLSYLSIFLYFQGFLHGFK